MKTGLSSGKALDVRQWSCDLLLYVGAINLCM